MEAQSRKTLKKIAAKNAKANHQYRLTVNQTWLMVWVRPGLLSWKGIFIFSPGGGGGRATAAATAATAAAAAAIVPIAKLWRGRGRGECAELCVRSGACILLDLFSKT